MKHLVVGTAGHIDHGKTELVKALTGVNTDRFKEEQERGITIDIGFAPMIIGSDQKDEDALTVGFVDVPGHEKFVKNMLAGIWGIDLVMLVVSADESIKPQTREHFDICSLLAVKRGLIALTKIDLVDPEIVDLVALEIRDFVRGSFLGDAPVIPVSARNRLGLDRLTGAIAGLARQVEPGRPSDLLRLPVDRSFTVKGFGTVVTGTLVSGSISEGDEVAVYPGGGPCRVRGLQVHNKSVKTARAGQRTAVNLQGVDTEAVQRGNILARRGQLNESSLLDVSLKLLDRAPAPLEDLSRIRFHQGTSEKLARVKLLNTAVLEPGQEALAQVRLEGPGCCLPGDRFVVRRYSPTVTIGGGIILDASPVKHRGRARPDLVARLSSLQRADASESLRIHLEGAPAGVRLGDLAVRAGRTLEDVHGLLGRFLGKGEILKAGEGPSAVLLLRSAVAALEQRVSAALEAYHRANPLRPAMPREELREGAMRGIAPETARFVVERLVASGIVRAERDTISLATHHVTLSPQDERLMESLEMAFRAEGLNPPTLEELVTQRGLDGQRATRVLHLLLASGKLVKIRDGRVFHAKAIETLIEKLRSLRHERRTIDIVSFKELTGTSRKNAIPLLEHLDAVKVTRRMGSDREILPPPGG